MKKLLLLLALASCCSLSDALARQAPKREMRGAWIATVANIDWPTKQGLDEAAQRQEMTDLLDKLQAAGMNAVIFQIRPTADAFYRSTKEPWSHWISGTQGEGPSYDPLQFVIDESDKRGMAVHVWLNPYRVESDTAKGRLADSHLYKKHPEYFVTYGKARYFNPGLEETREFVSSVVGEIVRNYDIDAIHMDDYFYPYKIKGEEFPDQAAFEADPRGFTDKADWRRDNVDLIIRQIHDTIVANKPWVDFGISPFGVWRSKKDDLNGSDTYGGCANYDDLYADILKWQKEGWVDYVTPQLYWHIGFPVADYAVLADWWNKHNYGSTIYIGQGPYRINPTSKDTAWQSEDQILRQIEILREKPFVKGSMFFSAKSVARNEALKEKLVNGPYAAKALMPESNRNVRIVPTAPKDLRLSHKGGNVVLNWTPGENNRRYVVYAFPKGKVTDFNDPNYIVGVTGETSLSVKVTRSGDRVYAVTALSPTHTESVPALFPEK